MRSNRTGSPTGRRGPITLVSPHAVKAKMVLRGKRRKLSVDGRICGPAFGNVENVEAGSGAFGRVDRSHPVVNHIATGQNKGSSTRLTQNRKREAKGIPTNTQVANPITSVRDCVPMVSGDIPFVAPKMVRLYAHDPVAQARRAETQRRQAAARKAGIQQSNRTGWMKADTERVQPLLSRVMVPQIMSALSVSEPYALNIRAGRRIPHPRHWLGLAELGSIKVLPQANGVNK